MVQFFMILQAPLVLSGKGQNRRAGEQWNSGPQASEARVVSCSAVRLSPALRGGCHA